MNLPPEKKAELMAKYGGAPPDKPKPPPMEGDEEMDPEERYVDSGDVLSEDDEEDVTDEGSGEMAMEPPPSEGASVNDETFNRRRGEEERAKKMPPIDKLAMREAARKAVGNG